MTDLDQCCRFLTFLIEYKKMDWLETSSVQLYFNQSKWVSIFLLNVWCTWTQCMSWWLLLPEPFLYYIWTCVSETSLYEFNMEGIMYEGGSGVFHDPTELLFQGSWRTNRFEWKKKLCSVCMLSFFMLTARSWEESGSCWCLAHRQLIVQ